MNTANGEKGCSPFDIKGVIVMTTMEVLTLMMLIATIVFGILNLKK